MRFDRSQFARCNGDLPWMIMLIVTEAKSRRSTAQHHWVTKWVTHTDRKIYLFRINELEGEFESSPGHHFPYFSRGYSGFRKWILGPFEARKPNLSDRFLRRMLTDWTRRGEQGSRPRVRFDPVGEVPVRAIANCRRLCRHHRIRLRSRELAASEPQHHIAGSQRERPDALGEAMTLSECGPALGRDIRQRPHPREVTAARMCRATAWLQRNLPVRLPATMEICESHDLSKLGISSPS